MGECCSLCDWLCTMPCLSSVHKTPSCLHNLATMKSALLSRNADTSTKNEFHFCSYTHKAGARLGLKVVLFLITWRTWIGLFLNDHISINVAPGFSLLCVFTHAVTFCPFDKGHSDRWEGAHAFISILQMISDTQCFLGVLLIVRVSSFKKYLFRSFAHFSAGMFCFLLYQLNAFKCFG